MANIVAVAGPVAANTRLTWRLHQESRQRRRPGGEVAHRPGDRRRAEGRCQEGPTHGRPGFGRLHRRPVGCQDRHRPCECGRQGDRPRARIRRERGVGVTGRANSTSCRRSCVTWSAGLAPLSAGRARGCPAAAQVPSRSSVSRASEWSAAASPLRSFTRRGIKRLRRGIKQSGQGREGSKYGIHGAPE